MSLGMRSNQACFPVDRSRHKGGCARPPVCSFCSLAAVVCVLRPSRACANQATAVLRPCVAALRPCELAASASRSARSSCRRPSECTSTGDGKAVVAMARDRMGSFFTVCQIVQSKEFQPRGEIGPHALWGAGLCMVVL